MAGKKKEAISYYEEFENLSIKIPWDHFIYILTNLLGLEMVMKKGSVRLFVCGDIRFTAHEPHGKGDKYVSKWDRMRAINALKKLGFLENIR